MTNKEIDALWDEVMRRPVANFRYDFARLVAAAEREACAKVCEPQSKWDDPLTAFNIAAAIRKRGEA